MCGDGAGWGGVGRGGHQKKKQEKKKKAWGIKIKMKIILWILFCCVVNYFIFERIKKKKE